MSALGQKQTFAVQKGMSALPPKADIGLASTVRDQNRIAIDHLRAVQNLTEFRPRDGVLNAVVDVYDQNCLRLLGIAV